MHYDIRLKCRQSGELEATEDIGYPTREAAEYTAAELNSGAAHDRYIVVACSMPGSDQCHDVDLAYWWHMADHEGKANFPFYRMVGEPTDDMIRVR